MTNHMEIAETKNIDTYVSILWIQFQFCISGGVKGHV